MFSGKKPDCVKCGFEIIIPENYEFIEILDRNMVHIWNGVGGIDASAISTMMKYENISDYKKFINKLSIYISAGLKKQSEDRKNGQKNRARIRSKR